LAIIKAVIFDMGGVLLRTEDPAPRTEAGRPFNMDAMQLATFVFASEAGLKATMGQITEEQLYLDIGRQLNLSGEALKQFFTLFWQGDRLDEQLIAFLRGLRPNVKTGLLSNAWSGARQALTTLYPCIDVFDVAIISAEVGMMKPFPEIYQLILKELGVGPQEAIYVDDMAVNVDAARELGIHAIQFTNAAEIIQSITAMLTLK
jgi:epoxide hydrolase-like predicted phosphatase